MPDEQSPPYRRHMPVGWALRTGKTEKRALKLEGDTMTWTTAAATVGGSSELVYKRIK